MPKGIKDFEVFSNYPVVIRTKNYTKASSLAELDADTEKNAIYHDTKNGWVQKIPHRTPSCPRTHVTLT